MDSELQMNHDATYLLSKDQKEVEDKNKFLEKKLSEMKERHTIETTEYESMIQNLN